MHRNSTGADPDRARATANFYRAAGYQQRIDFNAVRTAATGRWPALLVACGLDASFLRDRHGPCPGCGGTDRFRFDDRDGRGTFVCSQGGSAPLAGDGFGLLQHVHGWTAAEALQHVADALGLRDGRELPPIQPRRPAPAAQPDPAAVDRVRGSLNRLWAAAVPLDAEAAEPARRYLAARGLGDLIERADWPADLRLHPACPYWITAGADKRPVRIAELPALLALVRSPDGLPVGLHSTWLRPDGAGKAALLDGAGNPLPARKLRLIAPGAAEGGAARLYPSGGSRIAIGEGIETCLSVRAAIPDLPVWAGLTAGNLLPLAKALRSRYPAADLILLADDDDAGRTACERAARAVNGRVATVGGGR